MPFITTSQPFDFFRLLNEVDQQPQKHCARHTAATAAPYHVVRPEPTFSPRFDVVEVPHAYELFGELPGLQQSDVDIEFTDAQTIRIKGRTARASPSSSSSTPATPVVDNDDAMETSSDHGSDKSSLNATVEDDYDEADAPLSTPASTATVAPTVAEQKKPAVDETKKDQQQKVKYWVSERKIGSFARTFAFPQRIVQDEVTAELKSGILHVVVPKNLKSRKVQVQIY